MMTTLHFRRCFSNHAAMLFAGLSLYSSLPASKTSAGARINLSARGFCLGSQYVNISSEPFPEYKLTNLCASKGWCHNFDAQRFVSLYSGKGSEEIFTYWDPKQNPRALRLIRAPALVLLAGKDEYSDRPAKSIAAWFEKHLRKCKSEER